MMRPSSARLCPALLLSICALLSSPANAADPETEDYKVLKEIIVLEFSREVPHEWGPVVSGVKTKLKTGDKVVAVTLEASGRSGTGGESGLLNVLLTEHIPATVFVSGRWLDKNPDTIKKLAANPQFEIANLGLEARTCSVDGKSPDGMPATRSAEEVFAEIEKNARKIESVTGILPRFFRAGTAFYDDVAVRIARALGYEVVASSMATLAASAGAIVAISLDGPRKGAADDLRQAILKLRAKGFQFVKLSDYPLE